MKNKNQRTREIKLTHYWQPNPESVRIELKMYHVYQGNGKRNVFPSKRKAEAYLRKETKTLNMHVSRLNDMFAQLIAKVRSKWLVLTDKEYKQMQSTFEQTEYYFSLLFTRQWSPNYNYYIYGWLRNIINNLRQVMKDLARILRVSNHQDEKLYHKQYLAELRSMGNDLGL